MSPYHARVHLPTHTLAEIKKRNSRMFLEQPGNVYDKKAYEDIMVGDMKGFIVFPFCDERSVYGRCGGGKGGKSLAGNL